MRPAAPYVVVKPGNQYSGLAIDIYQEVGRQLGLKVNYVETSFDALVPGLQSKRIDMTAPMGDYLDRQDEVDFVDYAKSEVSALSLVERKLSVKSSADLCGKAVAIEVGAATEKAHVLVKSDPGLPVVVQFHAYNFQKGNDDLTQSLVRQRFAALSESGRWELCRHPVGESITTGELARRSGQPVSAVSRSLRTMRELGLVTSIKDGRYVHHRMDASILKRLGEDALRVLLR